jgi:uncharacterized protein YjbJ (UPF0337 family)
VVVSDLRAVQCTKCMTTRYVPVRQRQGFARQAIRTAYDAANYLLQEIEVAAWLELDAGRGTRASRLSTPRNIVALASVRPESKRQINHSTVAGSFGPTGPRPADTSRKGSAMDENRIAGTAKNIGGKVEEGFGRVTGDTKSQVEGMANQAAGAAQDLYGQARDSAADAAGAVRDSAASMEKWLRHNIETQPYTTALVAVGIGWFLGRMHRPL